jgi:hypothetical protein
MSDKEPAEWTPLTPEQWKELPNAGHTSLFTRDEVEAALKTLAPAGEIAGILNELYDGAPGTTFFYGELLTALSRLSPSAAERVRSLQL